MSDCCHCVRTDVRVNRMGLCEVCTAPSGDPYNDDRITGFYDEAFPGADDMTEARHESRGQ